MRKILAVLGLLLLAGCGATSTSDSGLRGTFASGSDIYDTGPLDAPASRVLEEARKRLQRMGYKLSPASDPNRIETEWDVHLSSMRKEGFRTRVEAWVDAVAGGTMLSARSFREINVEITQPLMESAADWRPAGMDDRQRSQTGLPAQNLTTSVKVSIAGLGPR